MTTESCETRRVRGLLALQEHVSFIVTKSATGNETSRPLAKNHQIEPRGAASNRSPPSCPACASNMLILRVEREREKERHSFSQISPREPLSRSLKALRDRNPFRFQRERDALFVSRRETTPSDSRRRRLRRGKSKLLGSCGEHLETTNAISACQSFRPFAGRVFREEKTTRHAYVRAPKHTRSTCDSRARYHHRRCGKFKQTNKNSFSQCARSSDARDSLFGRIFLQTSPMFTDHLTLFGELPTGRARRRCKNKVRRRPADSYKSACAERQMPKSRVHPLTPGRRPCARIELRPGYHAHVALISSMLFSSVIPADDTRPGPAIGRGWRKYE